MNEKNEMRMYVCKGVHLLGVSRSFKHVDEDSNDPKYFVEESG